MRLYSKYGKRVLDIFLSLTAFILIGWIMLIVALLIKLFDPGPVIFMQKRIGKNGKEFNFYKFRSMPVNTGDIPSDKVGQIKLTWIGKLIRRSNLDELPQLFNILKGDMSIVGPRPPIQKQTDLIEYRKQNGSLYCLPGLTGLAQIKSFDGMSVEKKAHYDGEYASNITFLSDVKIIINTFLYLFKPPPVY